MNQRGFESRVLQLWMTSRVPMTRANILFYTKADRKQATKWLEELVADGVLEVDADDDGEMIWSVRGATRPERGTERVEEAAGAGAVPTGGGEWDARFARLREQALVHVAKTGGGLMLAGRAAGLTSPPREGQKSLVASGLLSLFFGPLGWLYAAPWRVAIPASLIMLALSYFLGWHIVGFSLLFGAIGVGYAWRYNQNGRRSPLFGGGGGDEEPRALPRKG